MSVGCGDYPGNVIESYQPTCQGNCYKWVSFEGILVQGNGVYGTSCEVYSDDNCQNAIYGTGNYVGASLCHDLGQQASSMRCYYHC
jgi:hypothetical protein